MIKSFKASNFQSFKSSMEVTFVMSKRSSSSRLRFTDEGGSVISNVIMIAGANASGKTAILKIPSFALWFMLNSFGGVKADSEIPVMPHLTQSETPSSFELEFEHAGTSWKYELVCTKQRVIREALFKKNKKFALQFSRVWNDEREDYEFNLKNFDFPIKQARRVRPNASLISTSIQFNVELAVEIQASLNPWYSNVNFLGKNYWLNQGQFDISANYFSADPGKYRQMTEIMAGLDLGLAKIEMSRLPTELVQQSSGIKWDLHGIHQIDGKEYRLPFGLESDGTKVLFNLLAVLLPVLTDGGTAIIDELETDMHPLMLRRILDLFADPEINTGSGQLIFSSHSLEIMNYLEREQIYLVEKDTKGSSLCFPLSAIGGVREYENHYLKYMAGAYGAIPKI